jgi:hypothetical protein
LFPDYRVALPKIYAKKSEDIESYDDQTIWVRTGNIVNNSLLNHIIVPNLIVSDIIIKELKPNEVEKYVYQGSILPHFGATNYIILFDKNIRQFIPIPEEYENISPGEIKWIPCGYRDAKRYCWTTICLVSRAHHTMFKFPIREAQPQGKDNKNWPAIIRDTQRIGYTVMSVLDTNFLGGIENALIDKVKCADILKYF